MLFVVVASALIGRFDVVVVVVASGGCSCGVVVVVVVVNEEVSVMRASLNRASRLPS